MKITHTLDAIFAAAEIKLQMEEVLDSIFGLHQICNVEQTEDALFTIESALELLTEYRALANQLALIEA